MPGPFGNGAFGTEIFSSDPLFSTGSMIDAVLRNTGHANPASETNKRLAVLSFINNCYSFVSTKRPWDWLYNVVDTLFEGYYSEGTVSIDNRSQIVTGVGTNFSSNALPNNFLTVQPRSDRYVIDSIQSDTQLTLQGQFAGDDLTPSSGYQIIKPVYTAPGDCEQIIGIVLGDDLGKLVPMGIQEFRRKQARDLTYVGIPRWYTDVGRRAVDGVRTYEIYPAPDRDYTASLNYGVNIQVLSDSYSNYCLIPDRHRVVLYYGAMAEMYMFLRDAQGAALFDQQYKMALMNMQGDTKLTDSKYILRARRGRAGRRRRRYGLTMDINDFAREEDWL
jgi:hypothetical protein